MLDAGRTDVARDAGALLLDCLRQEDAGRAVLEALEATLEADVKTPDLGGAASTKDVADAVIKYLPLPQDSR